MSVEVLFFARAREIAGRSKYLSEASDLDGLIDELCVSFGSEMKALLLTSRLWVNEDPGQDGQVLKSGTR